MAITNTWSVTNMQHTDADGGVFLVYWSMVAASDGSPSYSASEGGKLRCEYDASSPTYIPYADLTEADVLGWVYASWLKARKLLTKLKLVLKLTGMQKCKSKLMLRQQLLQAYLGKLS
jgi:hypothetical protein